MLAPFLKQDSFSQGVVKLYSVYIHTFPNGKKYIGITNQNPEKRWSKGKGYKSSPVMNKAIKKYGWENISHEIIAEDISLEQASQMEINLIALHRTSEKKYGYNLSLGGISNSGGFSDEVKKRMSEKRKGVKFTEEHRRKISESQKGRKFSEEATRKRREKYKPLSEEHKRKISDSLKGHKAWGGNKGKHFTEEHKRKIGDSNREKKRTAECCKSISDRNSVMVMNVKDGIVYSSVRKASEAYGVTPTTIVRYCKGKTKNKDWCYVEKEDKTNV